MKKNIIERVKELKEMLDYNEKESRLHMPNEIFTDLKDNIDKAPHVAFSFSYVYLATWLYRHTKYFNVGFINNTKVKEILGYKPSNRTVNYLIKQGGLLEDLDYLESMKDFPISWQILEGGIHFDMFSDNEEYAQGNPHVKQNYFINKPARGFVRNFEDEMGEYSIDGTFYKIGNTTVIPFEVFLYCMGNKDIGCSGFYLYSYIKSKSDIFDEYTASLDEMSKDTGVPETSLKKILDKLKGYGLVSFRHNQEFFATNVSADERVPNSYVANPCSFFLYNYENYKRMEVITKDEYESIIQERENRLRGGKPLIEFDLSSLPY